MHVMYPEQSQHCNGQAHSAQSVYTPAPAASPARQPAKKRRVLSPAGPLASHALPDDSLFKWRKREHCKYLRKSNSQESRRVATSVQCKICATLQPDQRPACGVSLRMQSGYHIVTFPNPKRDGIQTVCVSVTCGGSPRRVTG
ncbi:unnamed protein product [Colias eurytheme]|nr:unnamed protein product [Colias eurytheme]